MLTRTDYVKFQQLLYRQTGIVLAPTKRAMVQSRLQKWLIALKIEHFDELYDRIVADASGQMLVLLINALSNNVTAFFREERQWIYLQGSLHEIVDPDTRRIRIWSAGCSSGEEPYSIVMFLQEHLPDFESWDVRVLATDISSRMLGKAIRGVYTDKELASMPEAMLQRNFVREGGSDRYRIHDTIRARVLFRRFNLVTGDYAMFQRPFDLIFCRNVMIYFDKPTQEALLMQLSKLMTHRSRLLVGHAESALPTAAPYRPAAPSIYRKG